MARPILETDESRLKYALGLSETDNLPEEAVDLYWKFERTCRKIRSGGVSDDLLITLAIMLGAGEPEPTTFLDTAKDLDRGTPVEIKWRNKWVKGTFYGISDGQIVAILENDSQDSRKLDHDRVRLPQ